MTNIQIENAKKQINQNLLYIDSAKFIVDSSVFNAINLPTDFILIDKNTGEVLDNFKRKGLRITYNGFHYYVANYTKTLRGITYNKFVLLLSAKVSKNYLKGIQISDLTAILEHLRELGYIDFKNGKLDEIINEFRLQDTDITYNKVITREEFSEVMKQFKALKRNASNKKVNVFNKPNNKGIQFGNRGDKYFFKIYNKSLEIQNEINELKIAKRQRDVFKNYEVVRFEMTIRSKKDYDSFGIENRFVSMLKMLKKEPVKIYDLIRIYYDKMIGVYKPKKERSKDDLVPTEIVYLSLLSELKEKGYDVYEMSVVFLSGFTGDKKNTFRMKEKFYKIMDVLFNNENEISEKNLLAMKGYDFIREAFFLN